MRQHRSNQQVRTPGRGRQARRWGACMALFLGFWCGAGIVSGAQAQPIPPEEGAVRDGVRRAVEYLTATMEAGPERFADIRRVAILALEGDDDRRALDLLTVAVTRTSLDVMERVQIESVLKEHQFAGDAFADLFEAHPETVARLGAFLGADACLIGRVEWLERDAVEASVALNLKLVDLATARILWAESAVGGDSRALERLVSWALWGGLVALATLVVVVAGGIAHAHRPKTESPREHRARYEALIAQDRALRTALGGEIGRAQRHLDQARSRTFAGGRHDQADRLHNMDNQLSALKRTVEQWPAPRMGLDPAPLMAFEQSLVEDGKTLAGRCDGVCRALGDGDSTDIDSLIRQVEQATIALEERLPERSQLLGRQ